MKVGVSGSHGFIGRHLVDYFGQSSIEVVRLGRDPSKVDLSNLDVVINLAGLAHRTGIVSKKEFWWANVHYATSLYSRALETGVKLFIQVSSIGVLGDRSLKGDPFCHSSPVAPVQDYARSKAEAENELRYLATCSRTGLCIVRPPLVYGSGCMGNMASMYRLASLRWLPLPFQGFANRRDFVSVYNLIDLLRCCTVNIDRSSGECFLVSDCESVSSMEFLELLMESRGNRLFNFSVSPRLIMWVAELLGLAETLNKFFANLEVNIDYTKEKLGWIPPYSIKESLVKELALGSECSK